MNVESNFKTTIQPRTNSSYKGSFFKTGTSQNISGKRISFFFSPFRIQSPKRDRSRVPFIEFSKTIHEDVLSTRNGSAFYLTNQQKMSSMRVGKNKSQRAQMYRKLFSETFEAVEELSVQTKKIIHKQAGAVGPPKLERSQRPRDISLQPKLEVKRVLISKPPLFRIERRRQKRRESIFLLEPW